MQAPIDSKVVKEEDSLKTFRLEAWRQAVWYGHKMTLGELNLAKVVKHFKQLLQDVGMLDEHRFPELKELDKNLGCHVMQKIEGLIPKLRVFPGSALQAVDAEAQPGINSIKDVAIFAEKVFNGTEPSLSQPPRPIPIKIDPELMRKEIHDFLTQASKQEQGWFFEIFQQIAEEREVAIRTYDQELWCTAFTNLIKLFPENLPLLNLKSCYFVRTENFPEILACCRHLSYLGLDISRIHMGEIPDYWNYTGNPKFSELKTLELSHDHKLPQYYSKVSDIVDVIHTFKMDNLKTLILEDVSLQDDERRVLTVHEAAQEFCKVLPDLCVKVTER